MLICCENEVMLEKYITKQVQKGSVEKPLISSTNVIRLKAVQEIIYLEEGKALTFDEVIGLLLKYFERSIQING